MRSLLGWAGVCGSSAIVIGAFGAHGLPGYLESLGWEPAKVSKRMSQFDVGVLYHLVHSAALLALAGLPVANERTRGIVFALMAVGVVLFSGSLYLLVTTDTPWLGAITPIGGVCWIAAWSWLAVAGFRRGPHPPDATDPIS